MTYKKMKFKDKQVFVKVDNSGNPLLKNGKASMKYRLDDEREYHPWPNNLTPLPGEEQSGSSAPREIEPRVVPAAPQTGPVSHAAIIAYTDGACLGNPGAAGLGYVVRWPDGKRVQAGEPLGHGTNNIAELTAILRVLELIEDKTQPIKIHTDSSYSIGVLTKGWKAKANQELIVRIKRRLAQHRSVQLIKVKGHAGVPDNELVDQLARTAAEIQSTVSEA